MADRTFTVLGLRVVADASIGPDGMALARLSNGVCLFHLDRGLPAGTVELGINPDLWAIARRLLPRLARQGRLTL